MRQVAACCEDALFCVGYALLIALGFAFFALIAVAVRPVLITALVGAAVAALVLPHFSPQFRVWMDSAGRS